MNKAALFFQTKDNNFEEVLKSPTHALDVIRRLLQTSGMILDYSNPIVRGHLIGAGNVRITAFAPPIIDRCSSNFRKIQEKFRENNEKGT